MPLATAHLHKAYRTYSTSSLENLSFLFALFALSRQVPPFNFSTFIISSGSASGASFPNSYINFCASYTKLNFLSGLAFFSSSLSFTPPSSSETAPKVTSVSGHSLLESFRSSFYTICVVFFV